jgi:hypothetical protein
MSRALGAWKIIQELRGNFNLSGVNSPPLAAYGMIDLF